MQHIMYIEKLHHFICASCKKWWSIGDWEVVEYLTCPHCCKKATIHEHENEQNELTREEHD